MEKRSFCLVLEQESGCDYTIGCGKRIDGMSATDPVGAVAEARERFLDEDDLGHYIGPNADNEITSAYIVEMITDVDLQHLTDAAMKKAEKKLAARTLAAERTEYERLKKKFGS